MVPQAELPRPYTKYKTSENRQIVKICGPLYLSIDIRVREKSIKVLNTIEDVFAGISLKKKIKIKKNVWKTYDLFGRVDIFCNY